MQTLLSEIPRLKLPSQRLAITIHSVDIKNERRLLRALLACRNILHHSNRQSHVYLDPNCIWEHLEEENEDIVNVTSTKSVQRLVSSVLPLFHYVISYKFFVT